MNPEAYITLENQESKPSMTEVQTKDFLREQNIAPLQDWKSGEPILYVLEENTRFKSRDASPGPQPPNKIPSIIRIDHPTHIDFADPQTDANDPERTVYRLDNEDRQIDYYSIDPDTKEVRVVRTSFPHKTAHTEQKLFVRQGNLFVAEDSVFAKS